MTISNEKGLESRFCGILGIAACVRPNSSSILYENSMGLSLSKGIHSNDNKKLEDRLIRALANQGGDYRLESIGERIFSQKKTQGNIIHNVGCLNLRDFMYKEMLPLTFKNSPRLEKEFYRHSGNITKSLQKKDGHYNEFFLIQKDTPTSKFYDDISYDALLLLAIRRMQLFKDDLALRIYNVCLPAGKITRVYNDTKQEFVVIPFITLHGKSNKSEFRKTISLSLLLVPIRDQKDELVQQRKMTANETYDCLWNKGHKFELDVNSPLSKFLGFPAGQVTTISLLKAIFMKTFGIILDKTEIVKEENDNIDAQIDASLQKITSRLSDLLSKDDISKFHKGEYTNQYANVEKEIRKMIHPYHYFVNNLKGSEIFPSTFDMKNLNVNDEDLFDSGYMVFYNPRESYLFSWHNLEIEDFPNYSMIWTFTLNLYMMLEIAALKVIIHSYYHEIDRRSKLGIVRDIEKELIVDLDEFYDQDLLLSSYKSSFNKIKVKSGIEESYDKTEKKVGSMISNLQTKLDRRKAHLGVVLSAVGFEFAFKSIMPSFLSQSPNFEYLVAATFGIAILFGLGMLASLLDRFERKGGKS